MFKMMAVLLLLQQLVATSSLLVLLCPCKRVSPVPVYAS